MRYASVPIAGVCLLAVVASAAGLFWDGLYRDADTIVNQARGQDLVTLLVGVPLLLAGEVLARHGSPRGQVIRLGALGYLWYSYASYAFLSAFNELFLVYVALFSLTSVMLLHGLMAVDEGYLSERVGGWTHRRATAVYGFVTAALVSLAWLGEIVPATFSGDRPEALVEADLATNAIWVLDLGVVLPAFVLTGLLLWRRHPWGDVAAGVLLVKAATLGLAVNAMALFQYRDGETVEPALVALFGAITVGALTLLWTYLRSFDHVPQRNTHEQPRPRLRRVDAATS